MDKLVSWQVFGTASVVMTYIVFLVLFGQRQAALLAAIPLVISMIVLFVLKIRAAYGALFTPFLLCWLSTFALYASPTSPGPTIFCFGAVVVIISALISAGVGDLRFHRTLASYVVQASLVCATVLYYT